MSDPDWDDDWDDDEDDDLDDDVDEEDVIALHALAAAMEHDGTGELAQAQREAWVAVSEEAMELKARRELRERREAAERRAAVQARREAEERAAREEAARVEAERRAVRQAAEAREQARAEAERRERAWREEEARREALRRRAEERRRVEAEERRAEERRRAREEIRAEERRRVEEAHRAEQLRAQEDERREEKERRAEEDERRAEEEERRAEEEAFQAEQEALRATEDRQLEAGRLQAADRHRADHERQRRPVDVRSTATVEARTDSAEDRYAPAGGANDSGPPHEGHQEGEPRRFPSADRRPLTGAELARWRSRLDLTQQAAADRLGVRQGTVSKAESRADAPLGPSLREALADALREERRSA